MLIKSDDIAYVQPQSPSSPSEQLDDEKQAVVQHIIVEEIRSRLIKQTYKFPHWCKYFALCMIACWALVCNCAIITTLRCLWFELNVETNNNYLNEIEMYINECDDISIIPLKSEINYNKTQNEMNAFLNDFQGYYYENSGSKLTQQVALPNKRHV